MSANLPQCREQEDGYRIDELPREHGSVGLGLVPGSRHDYDGASIEAAAVIDPHNDPRAPVPLENIPWREYAVGQPELALTVGVEDRQGPTGLSFSHKTHFGLRRVEFDSLGSTRDPDRVSFVAPDHSTFASAATNANAVSRPYRSEADLKPRITRTRRRLCAAGG